MSKSNKIVIKLKLIGNSKLEFQLVYLDKRFKASNHGKFLYFKSKITDFHIYSRRTLKISEKILRLPDEIHYKQGEIILRDFHSERERKIFLERLYQGLLEWANNFVDFKQDENNNYTLNGEYWVL